MSVPVAPISDATDETIAIYCPFVLQYNDINNAQLDINSYWDISRREILDILETAWWEDYCNRNGATQFNQDAQGRQSVAMNVALFIKDNEYLRQIDVYGCVKWFLKAVNLSLANPDENNLRNLDIVERLFDETVSNLLRYENFYDLYGTGVDGVNTAWLATNYFRDNASSTGKRRHFGR